jgi:CRP-like cAMP-binding protein
MTLLGREMDSGAALETRGWELVWRVCRDQVFRVERGEWDLPARVGDREDLFGWVVMKGLMCREVGLRDRYMLELMGPGDVVQPSTVAEAPALGGPVRLTAATQTTLMVLGPRFIRVTARWPAALAVVNHRIESQRQRLAIQALIAHLPRAEHRLLLQMWHLAERWGRVTPEGTVLELPLTHDLLGHLAAARRSTSTLALGALESDGVIRRLDDGSWLLTPRAEAHVKRLAGTNRTAGVLGETLKLRQLTIEARAESRALRAEAKQLRSQRGGPVR